MYQILYVEINVLCMLILLYIMVRVKSNIDQQLANITFIRLLISAFLLLVTDCIWVLVDGVPGTFFWWINNFTNASYMFLTGVATFNWTLYTESTQGSRIFSTGFLCKLYHIPMISLCIVAYSSPWTHLLFYVDSQNVYHRGNFYILQPLLAYIYIVISIIHLIKFYRNKHTVHGRKELITLCSFFVLPAIGSVISVFTFGAPTIWPFATLSLLMIYTNFQSYQISIDGLTHLNNRRQFDIKFHSMTANYDKDRQLYLFMMDIDHFKFINDTYGHYEGDLALKETAHILQQVSNNRDIFLARYGGDEFAILLYADSEDDADDLKDRINDLFSIYNSIPDNKYPINLSIGYALYHPPMNDNSYSLSTTQKALIADADTALYSEKKSHHQ